MNLRYMTSGESHGPELMAIVEGVPAGLALAAGDIDRDLGRRQLGYGRGGRMRIETDRIRLTSGVRYGKTLGTPIGMRILNADWKNWKSVMAAGCVPPGRSAGPLTVPRPGHADLSGMEKFGLTDIRSVLERASARETASRVAVGAIARRLLDEFGVAVFSHVVQIGKIRARRRRNLKPEDFREVDRSPVRTLDGGKEKLMKQHIRAAGGKGESVGGVFEVVAFGLAPGLGSYASGPERLGGRLGGALMSIPAIKGAEVGDGFGAAARPGSVVHDEIFFRPEKGFYRRTNHAGGLEGGITTGAPLVVRAAMKPIPTLTRPLRSVDIASGSEAPALKERSDVCAVPAAAVVGEAMVAIELAGAMLEKFAGDCISDMKEAYMAYLRRLRESWPRP